MNAIKNVLISHFGPFFLLDSAFFISCSGSCWLFHWFSFGRPVYHYAIDANTSNKLRGQLNKVCVFVWLSFHFVGNSSPTKCGEKERVARERVAFFCTATISMNASRALAPARIIRLRTYYVRSSAFTLVFVFSFIQFSFGIMQKA